LTFNINLFKSSRLDYSTPKQVYQILDSEFDFDFDPCPKKPRFDGLKIDWKERNFINPPYGSEITKWVDKALEE